MTLIPVKTPWVAKKMFPNYVWENSSQEKTMYLTFDDGPTPKITDWTLNVLKQYNAKATFFCIGKNIEKHPQIFHGVLNEGHAIGNHTHTHLNGWRTLTQTYLQNVKQAQDLINMHIPQGSSQDSNKFEIINQKSPIKNLFRPPYGKITPAQGRKLISLGYQIIMWNVLSYDWDKKVPKEKCLYNVLEHATQGSIIVFHDSVKAKKNIEYALPKALDHFSKQGFNFKAMEI